MLACAASIPGYGQDKEGRWAVGFQTGGNLWMNSYNARAAGTDGELTFKYGVNDAFSAGLITGFHGLKSRETPAFSGTTPDNLTLNAIPLAVAGWFSLAPGRAINPYYYAGLGVMFYQRETSRNGESVFLPDKEYRSSLHIPAGIGVEALLSRNLLVTADLGYGLLDSHVDALNSGKISWYASARVGVTILVETGAAEERLHMQENAEAAVHQTKLQAEKPQPNAPVNESDKQQVETPLPHQTADVNPPDPPAPPVPQSVVTPRETPLLLQKGNSFILKGVNFELDRAALTPNSEPALASLLNALLAHPDIEVLIVGHTDLAGSRDFNQSLSFHRAQAVYSWLVKRGIPAKRLMVAGKGADEPIADNVTLQGRIANRRIEIRVMK
jgi:OOP family OmpA-OmpF porin